MTTIEIKKPPKPPTLEQQILELELDQQAYIGQNEYKSMTVRNLVYEMNEKHEAQFVATEKGLTNGIYVIRVK